MSTWRRKALECLPEYKKDIEDESIYFVLGVMRDAAIDFHRENNVERLQKIYDFAEWCHRQERTDMWNAAGVSFYEHLVDNIETRRDIRRWVKPDIYVEIRGLLELRLNKDEMQEIDRQYPDVTKK